MEKHIVEEKQLTVKLANVKGVPISQVNRSAASSQTNPNATKARIGAKRPLEPSNAGSLVSDRFSQDLQKYQIKLFSLLYLESS